ncbi:MAG: lytic transglycosylase [Bacteroidetes bacterium]|nr:MAG: lytic transglycosylase [Bacteroidota bacterium]PIE87927.1 MAG: lytic transglycosylase [Bacteroidota bacterium]
MINSILNFLSLFCAAVFVPEVPAPQEMALMAVEPVVLEKHYIEPAYDSMLDSLSKEPVLDTLSADLVLTRDSRVMAMLDSLAYGNIFSQYPLAYGGGEGGPSDELYPKKPVKFHDTIVSSRIERLNAETPIDLVFNRDVQKFIRVYVEKKPMLTSRILGLADLYFPLFEEVLDRYDMPLELKYLAVVESALNPTAGSRAGAKGLWQFMYGTGKVYGLKVSSYVDDRFDPYKATVAACEHLTDLYDMYGNWSLALAAYNSGAGNVNRAIRKAGGVRNYWVIQPFLPRETRGYVPAFIAVNYVMNYASAYEIYPEKSFFNFSQVDTVTVRDVLAFEQLHEVLGIPMEALSFLNPAYKLKVIPATGGKNYLLRLPQLYMGDFLNNEQAIYNYKTAKGLEREKMLAQIKKAQERTVHVVRSGENLGLIARKYHCSVNNIKRWNRLKGTMIRPGQRLIVYPRGAYYPAAPSTTRTSSTAKSTNGSYVVKRGDNLGKIAAANGVSIAQLKAWNNLRGNTIHPGERLVVAAPSSKGKGSGKFAYYTVESGDTLWEIAQKYNVTVRQIRDWNNIRNAHRLTPGQKLKIAI